MNKCNKLIIIIDEISRCNKDVKYYYKWIVGNHMFLAHLCADHKKSPTSQFIEISKAEYLLIELTE